MTAGLCAPSGVAWAAIPFLAPGRLIVVAATIAGRPARLLLDTGEPGGLLLYDEAAARLGLDTGAPIEGTRHGLQGAAPGVRRPFRVDRLAVDNASWSGVEGAAIPDEPGLARAVGAPFDGILGAGLLEGHRLVLDYRRRSFTIDRSDRSPGGGDAAAATTPGAPLRFVAGRILTTVDLSGRQCAALIDTAAAATLVDSNSAGKTPAGVATGVIDADGRAAGLPAVRLGRITAGGHQFDPTRALAADLASWLAPPSAGDPATIALVIGADLLAVGRVTLDLGAGRFRLEPAE